jgi:predicted RNase H-like HicB family nuclease
MANASERFYMCSCHIIIAISEIMQFRVLIERDGDGVYVGKVPDLPGCATEGKTKKELMKNMKEAIQAYMESLKKHGDPIPVESVQISV